MADFAREKAQDYTLEEFAGRAWISHVVLRMFSFTLRCALFNVRLLLLWTCFPLLLESIELCRVCVDQSERSIASGCIEESGDDNKVSEARCDKK